MIKRFGIMSALCAVALLACAIGLPVGAYESATFWVANGERDGARIGCHHYGHVGTGPDSPVCDSDPVSARAHLVVLRATRSLR